MNRTVALLALPLVLLCLLAPLSAQAATFSVTTSACTGSGSLTEAILSANTEPGIDTVSIPAGMTVDGTGCSPVSTTNSADNFMFRITESVVIQGEGSGATLGGQMAWVTTSGQVTPLEQCPAKQDGTIIVAKTPGFLIVGQDQQDNSGISVTLRNLTVNNVNALARVAANAELTLENIKASRIFDIISCDRGAIEVESGGGLTVLDSQFEDIVNWATALNGIFGKGAISGNGAGSLEIQRSRFNLIRQAGTISWIGGAGSNVNVVSTQITNSNGISILGDTTTTIVNSLISLGISQIDDPDFADRIVNGGSGPMTIRGSTLLFSSAYCEPCDNGFVFPAYIQPINGSQIRIESSAIGVNVPGQTGPGELLGVSYPGTGQLTADEFTWIQPTSQQDAATLRAVTNQPGLLTGAPALPTFKLDVYEQATPILEQGGTPGLLIDAIDSAACGQANALLNPVDNSCLTTDVLGKSRVDANGRRSIGAVQINLAPTARIDNVGDSQVILAWTQPPAPVGASISGYRLQYRPFLGAPAWLDGGDVAGASTVTGTVGGLSRNAFEFRVVPLVNGTPETASASNVVSAIPYGVISMPTVTAAAGAGGAIVSWNVADTGGHSLDHYLLAWKSQDQSNFTSSLLVSHPTTSIGLPFLTNGVTYDINITAVAVDGAQSPVGSTIVTPYAQATLAYPSQVTLYEGFSAILEPQVTGLSGTPTYQIVSGALPTGLSLDAATGIISGLPAGGSSGSSPYDVTISLTQAGLPSAANVEVTSRLNVAAVADPLTLHYPDINVPAGSSVTAKPTVTGNATANLSFSMVPGDTLPAGLALDPSTGVIRGTPTTATDGFQGLSVQVTNTGGANTAVSPLVIQIQPTVIYPGTTAIVGDPLTIIPTVSNAVVPGTFAVTNGELPAGLILDTATGVISGTPTSNIFVVPTITYTQTGAQTQTTTADAGITINAYEITVTYPMTELSPGRAVSITPTVSGTKGNVTFALEGLLPDGLSLDPSTGVISGTPTNAATRLSTRVAVTDDFTRQVAAAEFRVTARAQSIPTANPWTLGSLAMLILAIGFARLRGIAV